MKVNITERLKARGPGPDGEEIDVDSLLASLLSAKRCYEVDLYRGNYRCFPIINVLVMMI
jgi:hypothetical protein